MSCVLTVSISIMVNGEALDPIYPSKGIRQKDPLSPYLFILYMDFFGQLIKEKCSMKLWQTVKASQSGPAFTHLLFADDLFSLPNLTTSIMLPLGTFLMIFVVYLSKL